MIKAPYGSQCRECSKPAELGVTSPGKGVLLFCRACAKRLAKRLKLTELAKQLAKDEPS